MSQMTRRGGGRAMAAGAAHNPAGAGKIGQESVPSNFLDFFEAAERECFLSIVERVRILSPDVVLARVVRVDPDRVRPASDELAYVLNWDSPALFIPQELLEEALEWARANWMAAPPGAPPVPTDPRAPCLCLASAARQAVLRAGLPFLLYLCPSWGRASWWDLERFHVGLREIRRLQQGASLPCELGLDVPVASWLQVSDDPAGDILLVPPPADDALLRSEVLELLQGQAPPARARVPLPSSWELAFSPAAPSRALFSAVQEWRRVHRSPPGNVPAWPAEVAASILRRLPPLTRVPRPRTVRNPSLDKPWHRVTFELDWRAETSTYDSAVRGRPAPPLEQTHTRPPPSTEYLAAHPGLALFLEFMRQVRLSEIEVTGASERVVEFRALAPSIAQARRGLLYVAPPGNPARFSVPVAATARAATVLDVLKGGGEGYSFYVAYPEDGAVAQHVAATLARELARSCPALAAHYKPQAIPPKAPGGGAAQPGAGTRKLPEYKGGGEQPLTEETPQSGEPGAEAGGEAPAVNPEGAPEGEESPGAEEQGGEAPAEEAEGTSGAPAEGGEAGAAGAESAPTEEPAAGGAAGVATEESPEAPASEEAPDAEAPTEAAGRAEGEATPEVPAVGGKTEAPEDTEEGPAEGPQTPARPPKEAPARPPPPAPQPPVTLFAPPNGKFISDLTLRPLLLLEQFAPLPAALLCTGLFATTTTIPPAAVVAPSMGEGAPAEGEATTTAAEPGAETEGAEVPVPAEPRYLSVPAGEAAVPGAGAEPAERVITSAEPAGEENLVHLEVSAEREEATGEGEMSLEGEEVLPPREGGVVQPEEGSEVSLEEEEVPESEEGEEEAAPEEEGEVSLEEEEVPPEEAEEGTPEEGELSAGGDGTPQPEAPPAPAAAVTQATPSPLGRARGQMSPEATQEVLPSRFFGYDFATIEGLWQVKKLTPINPAGKFVALPVVAPPLGDFTEFFAFLEQSAYRATIHRWDDARHAWVKSGQLPVPVMVAEGNGEKSEGATEGLSESAAFATGNSDYIEGEKGRAARTGEKEVVHPQKPAVALVYNRRLHPLTGAPLPPEYVYVADLDTDEPILEFPQPALQAAIESDNDARLCFVSPRFRRVVMANVSFLLRASEQDQGISESMLSDYGELLRDIINAAKERAFNFALACRYDPSVIRTRFFENFATDALYFYDFPDSLESWDFGVVWHQNYINKEYGAELDLPLVPMTQENSGQASSPGLPRANNGREKKKGSPNILDIEAIEKTRPALRHFMHFQQDLGNISYQLVTFNSNTYEFNAEGAGSAGLLLVDVRRALWPDRFILSEQVLQVLLDSPNETPWRIFCIDSSQKVVMEVTPGFLLQFVPEIDPAASPGLSQKIMGFIARAADLRAKYSSPIAGYFVAHLPLLANLMNARDFSAFVPRITREIIGIWKFDNKNLHYTQTYEAPKSKESEPQQQNTPNKMG